MNNNIPSREVIEELKAKYPPRTVVILDKMEDVLSRILDNLSFIFPIMINERYADAYPQIIILMYAMLLRVIVGLYSCVYIAEKDSKKVAYTSAASAVINIVVHVLLISRIGFYAALFPH